MLQGIREAAASLIVFIVLIVCFPRALIDELVRMPAQHSQDITGKFLEFAFLGFVIVQL